MAYSTEWNLSQLLDGKTPQEMLTAVQEQARTIADYRSRINTIGPEDFSTLVSAYESYSELQARIYCYAKMSIDTDVQNGEKSAFLKRVNKVVSEADTEIIFFTNWWKQLEDEKAEELLDTLPRSRHYFSHLREFKPHTLSESEEKIITLNRVTGREAHIQLYDKIDTGIKYDWDGKVVSEEDIRSKFKDADPEVRKKAYTVYYKSRANSEELLSELYQYVVLDHENERKLRNFLASFSEWNLANEIPDEVVDAHLEACRESSDIWRRYFQLKGKMLGIDFTRFDIYAPLEREEVDIPYEKAVEMTLEALGRFSPKLRKAAEEIYAGDFVHAMPIAGMKRGGAYCWGMTPNLPAFLLYNYTNKLDDVMTVAHETGHGVHHQLGRPLGPLEFGHVMPVAETASVFSEMLMTDMLLEQRPDLKKSILVDKLADMYATIGRQSAFVRFEKEAHRIIVEGGDTKSLSDAYMENLKEQFGDIPVDEMFRSEWLAIGHFIHFPFYCYAYSFGNLLTLALYDQFKKEGESFIPKYERFLEAGQSMDPIRMTHDILGVDISKKEFWLQGMNVVRKMVDDLESLVE